MVVLRMSGAVLWLMQRITAVLLLPAITIHFIVMRLGSTLGLHPDSFCVTIVLSGWFEMLLLGGVILHAMVGIWGIAHEYAHSRRMLRVFQVTTIVAAALLVLAAVKFVGI
jgi:succinate dehydrogenase hydrophobic anchor subunit